MIAPQVLAITSFLSIMWGIYLFSTIQEYNTARTARTNRRRGDTISAFRRMVVAFCLWLICFSYVFRTFMVLIGLGDIVTSQVMFFALLGTNIPGSIFAVISLRLD